MSHEHHVGRHHLRHVAAGRELVGEHRLSRASTIESGDEGSLARTRRAAYRTSALRGKVAKTARPTPAKRGAKKG